MDAKSEFLSFIRHMLQECDNQQMDIKQFDGDDAELAEALNAVSHYLYEAKEFATDIANGNLEGEAPDKFNAVAGPLRALRSNLLHLTWQSQRVSEGDYGQHVDFMGDFSDSFNHMIKQLDFREKQMSELVQEEREHAEELEMLANTDVVTGLYNRRYCLLTLSDLLQHKIPFVICFIDLNCLKQVNDNFSHAAGDIYLQLVASSIRRNLHRDDIVCRVGGDEMIVVMKRCGEAVARERLENIQDYLVQQGEERDWPLSISYGIIEVHMDDHYEVLELMSLADHKMYEFKVKYKEEHHLASTDIEKN